LNRYQTSLELLEARRCLAQVTFDDQTISTALIQASDVYAADLNGDGDLDVIAAATANIGIGPNVTWYDNSNGQGRYSSQKLIDSGRTQFVSVYTGDLDGDGDQDVLAASRRDDTIAWYENTDGKATFGEARVITRLADQARAVMAVDLDGDKDLDVLASSLIDDEIAWYQNNGSGTFGEQRIISDTANGPESIHAADLDKDGDLDVLAANGVDDEIAWYQNTDGKGTFSTKKVITTEADDASAVYAGDLDRDGDVDVLSSSYNDSKIAWYENQDGKGKFGKQNVITSDAVGARSVYAGDLDGDGDLDVMSASYQDTKIAWYKNLSDPPPPRKIGDANGDGIFNSSDLVVVFAAGEYEDGVPRNSTWEEGDWNGDQEFNTTDLVLAFQAGTYVNAAQFAARADVAAALDVLDSTGLGRGDQERTTERTTEASSSLLESSPVRTAYVRNVDRLFAEHPIRSRHRRDTAPDQATLGGSLTTGNESLL
jgi:hypothetical protein